VRWQWGVIKGAYDALHCPPCTADSAPTLIRNNWFRHREEAWSVLAVDPSRRLACETTRDDDDDDAEVERRASDGGSQGALYTAVPRTRGATRVLLGPRISPRRAIGRPVFRLDVPLAVPYSA